MFDIRQLQLDVCVCVCYFVQRKLKDETMYNFFFDKPSN